jgi:hypothetical protein
MDSQQLLNALHTAQRQAGGKAVPVRITPIRGRSIIACSMPVEVTYDPAPGSMDAPGKPEIHIKCL